MELSYQVRVRIGGAHRSRLCTARPRRLRHASADPLDELAAFCEGQRLQHDLPQPAAAAQLGTKAPKRMVLGELLAAVGPHHGQGEPGEPFLQRLQELQGAFVSPMKVVHEQGRNAFGRDLGEGAANRFEERPAVRGLGGRAQLRKERRQMRRERSKGRWMVARPAQVDPEELHDGAERDAFVPHSGAREGVSGGVCQHLADEAGLSDSRLTRDQRQHALAPMRPGEPIEELAPGALAPYQWRLGGW